MTARIFFALALAAVLTACASTPAGSPPPSPREQALQVDQEYALVQTAALKAVQTPQVPAAAKKQIAAATDASTAAMLAYSHQADNCFRDATGVVGNAPGKVCDQSTLATALAIAWATVGQANGLITAFAPSLAVTLPALPAN